MELYKKNILGRMVQTDEDDPDLEEIRLTVDEYMDLMRQRQDLVSLCRKQRQELQEAQQALEEAENRNEILQGRYDEADLQARIAEHDKQAERQRAAATERRAVAAERRVAAAEQRMEEIGQELAEAKRENDKVWDKYRKQVDLNFSLKQVVKVRSNQERGARPKRDHDGYLIMDSRPATEHLSHELTDEEYNAKPEEFRRNHRKPYTEHVQLEVWRTILQTPYEVIFPLKQIRNEIEDDIKYKIYHAIGCEHMLVTSLDMECADALPILTTEEDNLLYRWQYQANCRSRYWEIVIYTTQAVMITDDRLPHDPHPGKWTSSKKRKQEQQAPEQEPEEDEYF